MFEEITKDNWLLFAQRNYTNPTLETNVEFFEDIKRFKYLKRLFRKYRTTGDVKVRLIINHIVVLQNVFGADVATTLLLFKIDREYWSVLKTVLKYLKLLYEHEMGDVEEDEKTENKAFNANSTNVIQNQSNNGIERIKDENSPTDGNDQFNELKKRYGIRRYKIQEVIKPGQIIK